MFYMEYLTSYGSQLGGIRLAYYKIDKFLFKNKIDKFYNGF